VISRRPGRELSTRPLHFIWICDCSGSMAVNGKVQALNNAVRQTLPLMRQAAEDNANAQVLIRVLKFSGGAEWHVFQPTPVEDFEWKDLCADQIDDLTDMGKALSMVAEQLKIPPMSYRALPPVLVLIADGSPTDDFSRGLKSLMEQPWGKKAVRIAIPIGENADHEVLQKFISHPELKLFQGNSIDALVAHIKWVSTNVLSEDFQTAQKS
jgi:uncharacterized protein YegL